MVSINGLRQIVKGMHAVFPQGALAVKLHSSEQKLIRDPLVDKFIKETAKGLGVQFTNKSKNEIGSLKIFEVLNGLFASKKAGLKLPKIVEFKKMQQHGTHLWLNPKKINLNPKSNEMLSNTIHEVTHKNDLGGRLTSVIPLLSILLKLPGVITTVSKYSTIEKTFGHNYAAINREEFIACTAEKLIAEKKSWSDLDPKIKKLYDMFKGPKLKLDRG